MNPIEMMAQRFTCLGIQYLRRLSGFRYIRNLHVMRMANP